MPRSNAARRRALNLLAASGCALLLAGAYYLEYGLGMEPCPLCIVQRLALLAVAVVFLVAGLHGPRGAGAAGYALGVLVTAGAGIAVALRHLWLQSLPADQVPACGPGLDYMLEVMPLWETVTQVLQGSGECAEVDWVLGLPIPGWTLAVFVLAIAWAIVVNRPRRGR